MNSWYPRAVTIVLAGTATVAMSQGAEDAPLLTAQQAVQRKKVFAARCAACHGPTLQGGSAGPLTGPAFTPEILIIDIVTVDHRKDVYK